MTNNDQSYGRMDNQNQDQDSGTGGNFQDSPGQTSDSGRKGGRAQKSENELKRDDQTQTGENR